MNLKIIPAIIIFALLGTLIGWYSNIYFEKSTVEKELAQANPQLPEDAVKVSPCFREHGAHFIRPAEAGDVTSPFTGPDYIVEEKTGEVVGIEYHVSQEALINDEKRMSDLRIKNKEGELLPLSELLFPLFYFKYASADIRFLPKGHPGYEIPHYDLHTWFVTQEKLKTACSE
ncbi:MAG: hypothetical protein HYV47_02375 [Candidatus Nealsonbacteria bacterium]|nr:hypothetical protein [Candidatus Nealsonbacteria bacterium]